MMICESKVIEKGKEGGEGTKYHSCNDCVHFEKRSQTCYNSNSEHFENKIEFTEKVGESLKEVGEMLDFLIENDYMKLKEAFKIEA